MCFSFIIGENNFYNIFSTTVLSIWHHGNLTYIPPTGRIISFQMVDENVSALCKSCLWKAKFHWHPNCNITFSSQYHNIIMVLAGSLDLQLGTCSQLSWTYLARWMWNRSFSTVWIYRLNWHIMLVSVYALVDSKHGRNVITFYQSRNSTRLHLELDMLEVMINLMCENMYVLVQLLYSCLTFCRNVPLSL